LEQFNVESNNGQIHFGTRGLNLGVAKHTSYYNDGHIQMNDLYVAELENIKGAESSLLPAIAQGAASATNFCVSLLANGVPIDDCVVSVVVSKISALVPQSC
jgi:hypothetical protein